MIVNLVAGLAGQLIGLFGEKGKAAQARLDARVSNMARSWTDEFIVVVLFSPLIVGWFDPERANAWVTNVLSANTEYYGLLVAVIGAVFGLGKINGRR